MTETLSMEDGKGGATTPADDSGAIRGWGVFRREPWDFVGVFRERAEAQSHQQRSGRDYEIGYGTAHVGSSRFDVSDVQPGGDTA